jgi:hypothetical protein
MSSDVDEENVWKHVQQKYKSPPLEEKDSSEDLQPQDRRRNKRRFDLESEEDEDMKASDKELEV